MASTSEAVWAALQAEGWRVKPEVREELLSGSDGSLEGVKQGLLSTDLRKVSNGALPDDVNRAASAALKGPMVLQIMSVCDTSKPSYGIGAGHQRLLLLKLTDGRTSCKALEFRRIEAINEDTAPGTKVRLDQASIKAGVVLLDARSLHLLGGRVEALADAWDTQRRFGGTERPAGGADADTERPPPFQPFRPGESERKLGGAIAAAHAKGFVVKGGGAAAAVAPADAVAGGGAAAGVSGSGEKGPSIVQQALARAGAHVAKEGPGAQEPRSVAVAAAQLLDAESARQQAGAKAKLMQKLASSEAEAEGRRGRGRGGRRGRGRGRRRFGGDDSDDDGDDGGTMTLEEFEARRKLQGGLASAGVSSGVGGMSLKDAQMAQDEEMARQLQMQLDLEEQQQVQQQQQQLAQHQQQQQARQQHQQGHQQQHQHQQQQHQQARQQPQPQSQPQPQQQARQLLPPQNQHQHQQQGHDARPHPHQQPFGNRGGLEESAGTDHARRPASASYAPSSSGRGRDPSHSRGGGRGPDAAHTGGRSAGSTEHARGGSRADTSSAGRRSAGTAEHAHGAGAPVTAAGEEADTAQGSDRHTDGGRGSSSTGERGGRGPRGRGRLWQAVFQGL